MDSLQQHNMNIQYQDRILWNVYPLKSFFFFCTLWQAYVYITTFFSCNFMNDHGFVYVQPMSYVTLINDRHTVAHALTSENMGWHYIETWQWFSMGCNGFASFQHNNINIQYQGIHIVKRLPLKKYFLPPFLSNL